LRKIPRVEVDTEENAPHLPQLRPQRVRFRQRQGPTRVIQGAGIVTLHLQDVGQVTVRTGPLLRIAVGLQQPQRPLQVPPRLPQVALQAAQPPQTPVDLRLGLWCTVSGEQCRQVAFRIVVLPQEDQRLPPRQLGAKEQRRVRRGVGPLRSNGQGDVILVQRVPHPPQEQRGVPRPHRILERLVPDLCLAIVMPEQRQRSAAAGLLLQGPGQP